MAYTTAESTAKGQVDRNTFGSIWVATGRLGRVESGIWSEDDYLRGLTETLQRLQRIFDQAGGKSPNELGKILKPLIDELRPVQRFYHLLAPLIQEQAYRCRVRGENAQAAYFQATVEGLYPRRTQLVRRCRRRVAAVVKPVIAKAKSLVYQRLPLPVRRIADPAASVLKRLARLTLIVTLPTASNAISAQGHDQGQPASCPAARADRI